MERQLQTAEQRALEAEKKLADMQLQLQEHEQKAMDAEQRVMVAEKKRQEAEERAEHLEQAAEVAHKRAELAEENAADLEQKLFVIESDLEELLEYRELIQATQIMTLESPTSQQELAHSSNGSLKILTHSCNNSLSGFFIAHDQQQLQEVESLEQRQQCTGDKLSITSL